MAIANTKRRCKQYSQEYLKFGFIPSFTNETKPMYILCEKAFSNDAMKPAKMKDHLEMVQSDEKNKHLNFFKRLKEKSIRNQPNFKIFFTAFNNTDNEGRQKASYSIPLNIAKKRKSY